MSTHLLCNYYIKLLKIYINNKINDHDLMEFGNDTKENNFNYRKYFVLQVHSSSVETMDGTQIFFM